MDVRRRTKCDSVPGTLLNPKTGNCIKCKSFDDPVLSNKELLVRWCQMLGLPTTKRVQQKKGVAIKPMNADELCDQLREKVRQDGRELHDLLEVLAGGEKVPGGLKSKARPKAISDAIKGLEKIVAEDDDPLLAAALAKMKLGTQAEPVMPPPSVEQQEEARRKKPSVEVAQRAKRKAGPVTYRATQDQMTVIVDPDTKTAKIMYGDKLIHTVKDVTGAGPLYSRPSDGTESIALLLFEDGHYAYVGSCTDKPGHTKACIYEFDRVGQYPIAGVNDKNIAWSDSHIYFLEYGRRALKENKEAIEAAFANRNWEGFMKLTEGIGARNVIM